MRSFDSVNENSDAAHAAGGGEAVESKQASKLPQAQTFRHPKLRNISTFLMTKQQNTPAHAGTLGSHLAAEFSATPAVQSKNKSIMSPKTTGREDQQNLREILKEKLKKDTQMEVGHNFSDIEKKIQLNQFGNRPAHHQSRAVGSGDTVELLSNRSSLIDSMNKQYLGKKTRLPDVSKKEQETAWTGSLRGNSVNLQSTQYPTSKSKDLQCSTDQRIHTKRFSEGATVNSNQNRSAKFPVHHPHHIHVPHSTDLEIGSGIIGSPQNDQPLPHKNNHFGSSGGQNHQRKLQDERISKDKDNFSMTVQLNPKGPKTNTKMSFKWTNEMVKEKQGLITSPKKSFQIERLKGQLAQIKRNSQIIDSTRDLHNQSALTQKSNKDKPKQSPGNLQADSLTYKQKRILSTEEPERAGARQTTQQQQNMPSFSSLTSEFINNVAGMKSQQNVNSRGDSESKLNNLQNGVKAVIRDSNYFSDSVNKNVQKFQSFKPQNLVPPSQRSPGHNQKKLRIIESDQMFSIRNQKGSKANLASHPVNSPPQKIQFFKDRFTNNSSSQNEANTHKEISANSTLNFQNMLSQRALAHGTQSHFNSQIHASQIGLKRPPGGGSGRHEHIYQFIKNALENQHPTYFGSNGSGLPIKSIDLYHDSSIEENNNPLDVLGHATDLNRMYEIRSQHFRHHQAHNSSNQTKHGSPNSAVNDETLMGIGQKIGYLHPALEILNKQQRQKIIHDKMAGQNDSKIQTQNARFIPLDVIDKQLLQNHQFMATIRAANSLLQDSPEMGSVNKSINQRKVSPNFDDNNSNYGFTSNRGSGDPALKAYANLNRNESYYGNYDAKLQNELLFGKQIPGQQQNGQQSNQTNQSTTASAVEQSRSKKGGANGHMSNSINYQLTQNVSSLSTSLATTTMANGHSNSINHQAFKSFGPSPKSIDSNQQQQPHARTSGAYQYKSAASGGVQQPVGGLSGQSITTAQMGAVDEKFSDQLIQALMSEYGQKGAQPRTAKQKMQQAINQANKNISLTTMPHRKRAKTNKDQEKLPIGSPFDDSRITGNPHGFNFNGIVTNLANLDLSQSNPLVSFFMNNSSEKLANITIWHVENNVAKDTMINQAIKQSNELIRIANLSYYHQTKSEFSLSIKELKIMKQCGIHLTRMQMDSKAFLKSRDFQVLLKDRALKLLTNQLQQLQDLPVTHSANQTPIKVAFDSSVATPAVPIPAQSRPAVQEGKCTTPTRRKKTSERNSRKSKRDPMSLDKIRSRHGGKHGFSKKSSNDKFHHHFSSHLSPSHNNESAGQYHTNYCKFYVGGGNNFPLVRSVIKNRWWFQLQERCDFNKCNLIWTAWHKKKLCNQLTQFFKEDNDIGKLTQHLVGLEPSRVKVYARMDQNQHLANKKCLFYALKEYYEAQGRCVFKDRVFPVTFHIKNGLEDPEFKKLTDCFEEYPRSVWIVKPGENSNRGCGICILENLPDIERKVKEMQAETNEPNDEPERTVIIQKYIEKPLLVYRRKFDIRVFGMLTCVNGLLRGYFYDEGYLRTSSKEYNLNTLGNRFVHLTNDAIQQTAHDFGKFESGNKLSFSDFQKYLKVTEDLKKEYKGENGRVNFIKQILPQMRHLVAESFRAVAFNKIDPSRRNFSFEIFGFDFMIDDDFTVYLIEANTNPCLETNSSVLSRLIPVMLDSSLRIAVDPLLPPPDMNFKRAHEALHLNRYVQVFDESLEHETLKNLYLISQEEQQEGRDAKREKKERFILSDLIDQNMCIQTKVNNKLSKSRVQSPAQEPQQLNEISNHTKLLQDAIKFHGEHATNVRSISSINENKSSIQCLTQQSAWGDSVLPDKRQRHANHSELKDSIKQPLAQDPIDSPTRLADHLNSHQAHKFALRKSSVRTSNQQAARDKEQAKYTHSVRSPVRK